MKTVLLPTDFSENAFTAIKYAIDFHQSVTTRFVILHSYELPIGTGDAFVSINDMIKSIDKNQMAETLKRINQHYPDSPHKFETYVTYGSPLARVKAFIKKKNASLIVLGTKGATGLKKVFLGSNASGLLKRADCPVLVVPEGHTFSTPHKIGLATDLKPLSDLNLLNPLVNIVKRFNGQLLVFSSGSEGLADLTKKESEQQRLLMEQFSSIDDSYYFSKNKTPLSGIQEFIEEQHIQVLAMVTRESSFFKKLFSGSTVEKMAFETTIPLLAIHNELSKIKK